MSVAVGSLILAGGGDEEDSAPLDQLFASWVGDGKLVYLPVAMDGSKPTYAECHDWLESVFHPLGVSNIDMCTDVYILDEQRLAEVRGVYIGGGNTFRLLHLLRESRLTNWLVGYVKNGGKVYGGSAGAIIWGRDISTSQHADQNEVGLQDTRGLDKLNGYSLWCHYVPQDDPTIRTFIKQHDLPLIGLPERSGILVENGQITTIGYEPVMCFTKGLQTIVKIGERVSLP